MVIGSRIQANVWTRIGDVKDGWEWNKRGGTGRYDRLVSKLNICELNDRWVSGLDERQSDSSIWGWSVHHLGTSRVNGRGELGL